MKKKLIPALMLGLLLGSSAAAQYNYAEEYAKRSADKLNGSVFLDVTEQSGIHHLGHGKCIVLADIDRDGDLDVYMSVVYGGNKLYLNQGNMRFEDATESFGVGDPHDAHGIVIADFNNDTFLDIFVANNLEALTEFRGIVHQPNNFYIGGSEAFADKAATAGLIGNAMNFSCGVTTADLNGDGFLDMFVAEGGYRRGEACVDSLYLNNGNGTFRDIAAQAGVANDGNGYTTAFCDYDNDGHPDLFVAGLNDNESLKTLALYRNNGDLTFTDVTETLPLETNGYTVSAFWLDVNNDGWQDLFLGNSRSLSLTEDKFAQNALLINNGDGTFRNASRESGVAAEANNTRGVTAGDINNDGFIDIIVSNSMGNTEILVNDGRGRFTNRAAEYGGAPWYGHGLTLGDLDGDGDLDMVAGNWRQLRAHHEGRWRVFENQTNNDGWLLLDLVGTVSNPNAVMSKVAIYEVGHAGDRSRLLGFREVTAGNGTFPGNPLQVHFGLGQAERVDVQVIFPSGREVTQRNVGRAQRLTIVEP